MHEVLKAFPCSFDGIHSEKLAVGDQRDFGSMAEGLKKAGLIGEIDPAATERDAAAKAAEEKRLAKEAEKDAREKAKAEAEAKAKDEAERDAASKAAEVLRADLMQMTAAQLREKATEAKLEFAEDAKKEELVDALIVAAATPQA